MNKFFSLMLILCLNNLSYAAQEDVKSEAEKALNDSFEKYKANGKNYNETFRSFCQLMICAKSYDQAEGVWNAYEKANEYINYRDHAFHPIYTPLMAVIASPRGKCEVAKFLIEKGSDVNLIMSHGTPLELAIICGKFEIAKMLINHEKINLNGRFNLHWAAYKFTETKDENYLELIALMLQKGAKDKDDNI